MVVSHTVPGLESISKCCYINLIFLVNFRKLCTLVKTMAKSLKKIKNLVLAIFLMLNTTGMLDVKLIFCLGGEAQICLTI